MKKRETRKPITKIHNLEYQKENCGISKTVAVAMKTKQRIQPTRQHLRKYLTHHYSICRGACQHDNMHTPKTPM